MEPIAIIGLGCRFPKAKDPDAFWQLLKNGVDAITEVPGDRWNVNELFDPIAGTTGKICSRWGGFLDQVDHFDASFFRINSREAQSIDPQQRILLEVAWEALENAGLIPEQLAGSRTGVFIGISTWDYNKILNKDYAFLNGYVGPGTSISIVANRLSYLLNLRGPSMAVDTACSSSLVAVHLACQSLHSKESDLVLTGGVNLILSPETSITFSQSGMLAVDGRCKSFDERADGYVRGEGCGIIILKRYEDALMDGDRILGLLRGSAVNQDGLSNGLTAPNGFAQQAVIREALVNARVAPHEISYVETHGTGTSLGDPIEVNSLKAVLMEGRQSNQLCWIGSVKTNIGHLEAAAGVAGLIKVVLSLQHGEIPPHLHLKQLNPYIELNNTSIQIPTKVQEWPVQEQPRLAGISSFGFGGTNAHVILSEAPVKKINRQSICVSFPERSYHLLTLSAKTESALQALASRYQHYLEANPKQAIADICFTANTRRSHFNHRLAVIVESREQLINQLAAFAAGKTPTELIRGNVINKKPPKIAFLFTGQGSQYLGMGRQLYETQPIFRQTLDLCDRILRPYLEKSLLKVIYPESAQTSLLDQTAYTQPALFALEYALVQLWKSWGVEPTAVMGHSVGEYVAACVAGIFSLEDGLKLIAARGRLMQQLPSEGEMVAVFSSETAIRTIIEIDEQKVAVAAYNGEQNTVISGETKAVRKICAALEITGITTKKLVTSHPFHSPLMEPMLAEFKQVASSIIYDAPQINLISNVTGEQLMAEAITAEYWCSHVSLPVQFAKSLQTLHAGGYEVFVEIGPKATLLGMGRNCLPGVEGAWLPSLRPESGDWQILLNSLAELYVRGVKVDWSGFDRDYARYLIELPTYPFQRERYWVSSPKVQVLKELPTQTTESTQSITEQIFCKPNILDNDVVAKDTIKEEIFSIISVISRIPKEKLSLNSGLRELGFDSLIFMEMRSRLIKTFSFSQDLPLKLFLFNATIESLIDFVSTNLKNTSSIENNERLEFNMSSALVIFRDWVKEFQPQKIIRIEKHWVHKAYEQNVLISRSKKLEEDFIIGEAVQDISHSFFYEHAKDHVPGLYILEVVRQFGTAMSHLYYNIPMDMPFILDEMQSQFYKFAETNEPLFLTAQIQDKIYTDGLLICMQVNTLIIQNEGTIASVNGIFRIFDKLKYKSLRQ